MNEIFHLLLWLGLVGVGLWVLFIGLQFVAVIIGVIGIGIAALVSWFKQQLK